MGKTSLINAVNTNSFKSGNMCTYCDIDNHTIDRCYRKNGFLRIMLPEEEEETKVA